MHNSSFLSLKINFMGSLILTTLFFLQPKSVQTIKGQCYSKQATWKIIIVNENINIKGQAPFLNLGEYRQVFMSGGSLKQETLINGEHLWACSYCRLCIKRSCTKIWAHTCSHNVEYSVFHDTENRRKKSRNLGRKQKNVEFHRTHDFWCRKFWNMKNTVKKRHKNKAKTNRTKLCICQKSGSNLFSVYATGLRLQLLVFSVHIHVCTVQWACCIQCSVGCVYIIVHA